MVGENFEGRGKQSQEALRTNEMEDCMNLVVQSSQIKTTGAKLQKISQLLTQFEDLSHTNQFKGREQYLITTTARSLVNAKKLGLDAATSFTFKYKPKHPDNISLQDTLFNEEGKAVEDIQTVFEVLEENGFDATKFAESSGNPEMGMTEQGQGNTKRVGETHDLNQAVSGGLIADGDLGEVIKPELAQPGDRPVEKGTDSEMGGPGQDHLTEEQKAELKQAEAEKDETSLEESGISQEAVEAIKKLPSSTPPDKLAILRLESSVADKNIEDIADNIKTNFPSIYGLILPVLVLLDGSNISTHTNENAKNTAIYEGNLIPSQKLDKEVFFLLLGKLMIDRFTNKDLLLNQEKNTIAINTPYFVAGGISVAKRTENKIIIGSKNAIILTNPAIGECITLSRCQNLANLCFESNVRVVGDIIITDCPNLKPGSIELPKDFNGTVDLNGTKYVQENGVLVESDIEQPEEV